MSKILNEGLEFDEVRWATMRKTSYDSRECFRGTPRKTLLAKGTRLFRLVPMVNGDYFGGVWWMPARVFQELRADAAGSRHGGGRLFRNYVAEYLALPTVSNQLSVVEIELNQSVYAWIGAAAALFERPGGLEQCFLPGLAERGSPRVSDYARVANTYWLCF